MSEPLPDDSLPADENEPAENGNHTLDNKPGPIAVERSRTTEDDMNELDYEESSGSRDAPDACNAASVDDDDGELSDSGDEASNAKSGGNNGSEEKEDGELEDGEISDSEDDDASSKTQPVNVQNTKSPIQSRLTRPLNASGSGSSFLKTEPRKNETYWERGLREAREAMKRANKVRQDPDFETKRFTAAPGERSGRLAARGSDSDRTPSPSRRSFSSRSPSCDSRIPSLMDIPVDEPSPTPKYNRKRRAREKDRARERDRNSERDREARQKLEKAGTPSDYERELEEHKLIVLHEKTSKRLPPIRRSSPKYMSMSPMSKRQRRKRSNSRSSSKTWSRSPSPTYLKRINRRTRPRVKYSSISSDDEELGPQVLYPNGRPNARRDRERERERDIRDRERELRERERERERDLRERDRERRERERGNQMQEKDKKRRRSLSPPGPPRSRVNSRKSDRNQGLSPVDASPISSDSDSSSSKKRNFKKDSKRGNEVSDPWARKKRPESEKMKRYARSRSRSSSSISSGSRVSSRSSSRSPSPIKNLSPPRGDISSFRIPKKNREPAGKERDPPPRKKNMVDEYFTKKIDVPAAFRLDRKRRESSGSGNDRKHRGIEPSKAEDISGTESDASSSSSSSTSDSGSSKSSVSRSPSPSLPARYRLNENKKNPSPLRLCSISPPAESTGRDRKSVSPPPPPPPEHYPSSPPPKKKKNDSSTSSSKGLDEKEKRKLELMEQLRKVEEELKKKRQAALMA